jgi:hypothetical protein
MVKVASPLFSEKAHGSVGQCLTFSSRDSGEQVRYQRRQNKTIYFDHLLSMMSYYSAGIYGFKSYGRQLGIDN